MSAIVEALPPGSSRTRTQTEFMRAAELHLTENVQLRADGRRNALAVVRVIARYMDWEDRTSRPTHDRIQAQTGLSRACVSKWVSWWQEQGFLGTVQRGMTPQFRPMGVALAQLPPQLGGRPLGNVAARYVLAIPHAIKRRLREVATKISWTPSWELSVGSSGLRARDKINSPIWDRRKPATTRADRLRLVRQLTAEVPTLRKVSERRLRHVLRPWLGAGWTVADVRHALVQRPDGGSHRHTTGDIAHWARFRLRRWCDARGRPWPPPVTAGYESVRAERDAQVSAQRDARAAERAAAVPPTEEFRAVRRKMFDLRRRTT